MPYRPLCESVSSSGGNSPLRLLISDFPELTIVLNGGGGEADQIVESVGRSVASSSALDVSLSDKSTLFRRSRGQTNTTADTVTAVGRCVRVRSDRCRFTLLWPLTEKEKINLLHSSRGHPLRSTHKSDGRSRNRADNGGGERVAKGREGDRKSLE